LYKISSLSPAPELNESNYNFEVENWYDDLASGDIRTNQSTLRNKTTHSSFLRHKSKFCW
jgi:hypothetical protein